MNFSYGILPITLELLQGVTNFIDLMCFRHDLNEQKMFNSVYTGVHSKLHMIKMSLTQNVKKTVFLFLTRIEYLQWCNK
jgi:hypothetical protein